MEEGLAASFVDAIAKTLSTGRLNGTPPGKKPTSAPSTYACPLPLLLNVTAAWCHVESHTGRFGEQEALHANGFATVPETEAASIPTRSVPSERDAVAPHSMIVPGAAPGAHLTHALMLSGPAPVGSPSDCEITKVSAETDCVNVMALLASPKRFAV